MDQQNYSSSFPVNLCLTMDWVRHVALLTVGGEKEAVVISPLYSITKSFERSLGSQYTVEGARARDDVTSGCEQKQQYAYLFRDER